MKSSQVNYDTQWTHRYFEPSQAVYFKANTPIKEIVSTLGKEMGKVFPKLQEDYQTQSVRMHFNRLYRNLRKSYKGWQVFYREPNSSQVYHPINEKIGYKPRALKQSLQQTVLKKTLRWTHELDPLISPVQITNAANCQAIADQLNEKIAQPCYKEFFSPFKQDVVDLYKIYQRYNQGGSGFENLSSEAYNTFCHHLQRVAHYYQPINFLNSKNYHVRGANVSDVLQITNLAKSAKGWRVEIIEKTV